LSFFLVLFFFPFFFQRFLGSLFRLLFMHNMFTHKILPAIFRLLSTDIYIITDICLYRNSYYENIFTKKGKKQMLSKKDLRRDMKILLAKTPSLSFRNEGLAAGKLLAGQGLWQKARTVLLFLSMDGEIDTGPLLELAFRDGKKVFVPRVEGENLRFCRIASPAGPWASGAFGIREPPAAGSEAPGSPALILVPGLAFDRQGRRLGRGGGYYDRFLAGLGGKGPGGTAPEAGKPGYFILGLCLACQVVDQVPVDEHDRKMDLICTGTGIILPPDTGSV
jgi:5-formyltetrahydrofolate cyclo-ligase